jgi:hypothetical protein
MCGCLHFWCHGSPGPRTGEYRCLASGRCWEEPVPDYPPLSSRLVGETESALGALLAPLLAEAGLTFLQWVVHRPRRIMR